VGSATTKLGLKDLTLLICQLLDPTWGTSESARFALASTWIPSGITLRPSQYLAMKLTIGQCFPFAEVITGLGIAR
jgi:hypothetical protein